jgi:hypothetical protein
MDFQTLLNDYNGSVLLEPGTSEWGYVEQQWYLMVPFEFNLKAEYNATIGVDALEKGINFANFVKANYDTLVKANALASEQKALFGTLLRVHAMKSGIFCPNKNQRCVVEDEYQAYTPIDNKWENVNVPNVTAKKDIASFVKKFGDTFIQMMVYVFCSRGHHWQDEFDGLYDRLMDACGIIKPSGWAFPSNKEIFRQILHCFGVALPLQFTLWCRDNNRMANPIRLRFTPHAPIAGAAQITTLGAVLTEMQTEGWWQPFYEKFDDHIKMIYLEVEEIKKMPYSYHVASRVVTGKPKLDVSLQATTAFKTLSQLALGYIDHLGRKHSLSGQKVITKKSGGMKPVAEAFSRACDRFGKPSADVPNMATFLSSF